jgi:uncharacterized protein YxjI
MFSPQSKVWIYQSERLFTSSDLAYLHETLAAFTESWTAHTQQLKAGYEIKYGHFIVLIVDETLTGASGCSIDKSVHLMKEIEQKLNIDLFDRFQIAWKNGDDLIISKKSAFEQLAALGLVNNQTIVFNNLVKDFEEYQNAWETPLANSWHARVFNIAEQA